MITGYDNKVIATKTLALVGNPNVGKSVIFGRLTGRYVTVSNYPGTTVDVSHGSGWFGGEQLRIVDTPGIISLYPKSEDERVTRDLLLRERPQVVVQVADAKNLRRTLMVTLELAELEIPMVLALNMSDEARERGIEINTSRLSEILGIPVVETVGITGEGIVNLRKAISQARVPSIRTQYLNEVEAVLSAVEHFIPELPGRRFVAQTVLSKDFTVWTALAGQLITESLKGQVTARAQEAVKRFVRPLGILSLDSRHQKSSEIVSEVVQVTGKLEGSWAQSFGRAAMRPWPGYLIALGVLFGLYEFVGVFGAQFLVDLLESGLFEKILNPAMTKIVNLLIPFQVVRDMIVGPYGIFTMAITYSLALIFPIVSCFFLFFGLLEDSGYLPRLAVMLDRLFRVMGLNGKAVLPMILGLGCDTMAVLTTRVLDSEK
jgi:ferrous iron transport protein B